MNLLEKQHFYYIPSLPDTMKRVQLEGYGAKI
jgi:hypothetical protein